MKTPLTRSGFLTALLFLFMAAAGSGCGNLSGPGSASFASVMISNHTPAEIAAAATQVFAEDGYAGGATGGGQLVFQKEASRGTSMARDGIAATQAGARSLNRVRAEIVPLGNGTHRLQCQAYMVTGAGDSFFEDEVRLANLRSGPYRSLLNRVADRLK